MQTQIKDEFMDIQSQTMQNTRDIGTLTAEVREVTALMRFSEKRHDEERADMKDVVSGLKSLNDKMANFANMQEKVGELSNNMSGLRHDLRNMENAFNIVPKIKEDITDLEKKVIGVDSRLDSVERWRIEAKTAWKITKLWLHCIWAAIGILSSVGTYFYSNYHTNQTTYYEKKISGE